jgi:hypothetical protein
MFIEQTINPPILAWKMQGARIMPTIMGMALGHSILAWGMLTANGMPTFGDHADLSNSWHGE